MMARLVNGMKIVMHKHPVVRGMFTFAFLFPASNTTQQLLNSKKEKFNPFETLRFGIFGTFVLAPTLYAWVRLAGVIVKADTLRGAVIKALVEQFTWAPFAYVQFYMCINLMEGKSLDECVHQCRVKIPETWKVGVCVWPVIQTVNFWVVPMRNRVPFVAFFSYLWNTFLSFMHHWDIEPVSVEASRQPK